MQLGMIGLGRMGANMVRRLLRGGHACVVFDRSQEAVQALVKDGAVGAASLAELVKRLSPPRAGWVVVPAGGLERASCLMIGGDDPSVNRLAPIFASLAPPIDSAPRTRGRERHGGTAEHGYLHCGPGGAGRSEERRVGEGGRSRGA